MSAHPRSSNVGPLITAAIAVIGVVVAASLLGLGRTSASTPASPPPIAVASASAAPPASSPTASPAAPSATPAPSSPSSPIPARAWSAPRTVAGLEDCLAVVAAIDDAGADHLAAACGQTGSEIRYAVAADGATWTTTVLKPPSGRLELDPQLAVAGRTLYLAYTRVAPTDGGCGSDGLQDVGVYYRTRSLPAGAWSAPIRLGLMADHLQSFRVTGSTLYATVTNEKDAKTWYETQVAGRLIRTLITDAAGWTSLRVGDDGKGRVAYESTKGIAYGMTVGNAFVATPIPDSTNGWDPVLALAPGNDAYLLWNRSYHGAGCVGQDPDPRDGTYFATNAGGTWVTTRLTTAVGGASLTLDPSTGEVRVVVSAGNRVVYFHRLPGNAWAHETIGQAGASSPVIRENATTGALLVADIHASDAGPTTVETMTRG